MSELSSALLEKSSAAAEVPSDIPDSQLARELLGRVLGGLDGSVKARLRAAAVRLDMPHRRVRAIHYGEARIIAAHEMERLRAAAAQAPVDRVARLMAALQATDPEFFAPDIAALTALQARLRRFARRR